LLAWATGQIDEALRQKPEFVLDESHSMVVSFSCCSSSMPYGEPIPEPGFAFDQGSILAAVFKGIAQVINKFFDR
jgi:hypothetical protein